jgi:hypothetical protein
MDSIKELEGPSIIHGDKISTKEEFELKLKEAKISLGVYFDGLTNFPEAEIHK